MADGLRAPPQGRLRAARQGRPRLREDALPRDRGHRRRAGGDAAPRRELLHPRAHRDRARRRDRGAQGRRRAPALRGPVAFRHARRRREGRHHRAADGPQGLRQDHRARGEACPQDRRGPLARVGRRGRPRQPQRRGGALARGHAEGAPGGDARRDGALAAHQAGALRLREEREQNAGRPRRAHREGREARGRLPREPAREPERCRPLAAAGDGAHDRALRGGGRRSPEGPKKGLHSKSSK